MKCLVSFLLVILIMVSCKEEAKSNTINKEELKSITKVETPYFSVSIKGVFQKPDKFALFYIQEENEKYTAEQLVTKAFEGSIETQEVSFQTPEGVYPLNFRLDFGSNKEQLDIEILECILKFKNSTFSIKGKDLRKYFRFNDGIVMQSDSTTFKLKTFKLRDKEVYDPYINGKQTLVEALELKL